MSGKNGAPAASYTEQTVQASNPLVRFSHRRRLARSLAYAVEHLPPGGVIADIGAGEGDLLLAVGDERPDVTLYAIEPYTPKNPDNRINYISSLKEIGNADVITCFEVFEHLRDETLDDYIRSAHDTLSKNGRFIVSVPIMGGLALPMKVANTYRLWPDAPNYSLSELMLAVFGQPVKRPADWSHNHKGFDFRILRNKISEYFIVEKDIPSPLPLPWWCNSQMFFICRSPKS